MSDNTLGVMMSSQQRKYHFIWSCLVTIITLFLFSRPSFAQVVTIPLTLDEQLLTSLLIESSFPGKGQSADVVGREGDCVYVKLEQPRYRMEDKLLRLEMALTVHGGTEVGGQCLFPVQWQGYLVLWQKPVFVGDDFTLSFNITDSALLNQTREPAVIAGMVWDLVKDRVYEHLEKVQVDLAPPVSRLRNFLGPLFKQEFRTATSAMLASLHRGEVYVKGQALIVELVAEVDEAFQADENAAPLTPGQRADIVALWERWDSFLVHFITLLAHGPLQPEDRMVLMDSLLESRYAFSAALAEPELEGDLVRVQFLHAWENLAPLFRKQLYDRPVGNTLGFLAFFTAVDALKLFDAMGPTFGIELSQQGLLNLAEMLSGKSTPLPYMLDLDEGLRKIFELRPQQQRHHPARELKEIDLPDEAEEEPLSLFFNFLVKPAHGDEGKGVPGFSEILKWKVPAEPYPEYVTRVRGVLKKAADKIVNDNGIPASLNKMFVETIPAMAWQESCFRQFVVKKKKLTYLLSYNGSSVGLMQINERIWRGLYDLDRLRWDINYNAAAGCEIVALYLNRYVLRDASWVKGDKPKLLARLLYSMYNGGPGQYKKFLQREKTGKHYKSDKLFAEKLEWTKKKEWENIRLCLIGG